VRKRFSDSSPTRLAGTILVGLTGLFIFNAVAECRIALAGRVPIGALNLMLWIADLTTAPAYLAGGILLLRRKALGYAGGAGLLLAYIMLFIGIIPVMIYPALYDGSPVEPVGIVMMLAASLICRVPLVGFLRAMV
jgi:hypothetical protein